MKNSKKDKSEIKSDIMLAISEELDLWLEKESTITSGYEYENEFIEAARKMCKIMLSKSIGETSSNRNEKKNSIHGSANLK